MATRSGRLSRIMYGANTIAGLGTWTMTGVKPEFLESTSFGDTVKKWERAGIDDAGDINFSGLYDPTDTNGQVALNALKSVATGLTNLYFYELYDTTNSQFAFWRVGSGGDIKLGNFNALEMTKNGLGTISFTGKISGAFMERVA